MNFSIKEFSVEFETNFGELTKNHPMLVKDPKKNNGVEQATTYVLENSFKIIP